MARLGRAYPVLQPVRPSASSSIIFDSATSAPGSNFSYTSGSWTHTVGPNGNALIVVASIYFSGSYSSPAITATANGTSMTLLTSFSYTGATSNPWMAVFGLLNPSVGSNTINMSYPTFSTFGNALGGSISYQNVGSFGSAVTANDSTAKTVHSMSVANNAALLFNTFTTGQTSYVAQITSYNQTTRKITNLGGVYSTYYVSLMGDAPGGSKTFSVQTAGNNTYSASVVVPLIHS